jgi:hypothetical protein
MTLGVNARFARLKMLIIIRKCLEVFFKLKMMFARFWCPAAGAGARAWSNETYVSQTLPQRSHGS